MDQNCVPIIALTYANDKHTDGAGAQLQRIYGIYSISRLLSLPYVHTPIKVLDHQGIEKVRENAPDHNIVNKINKVYSIPSDIDFGGKHYVAEISRPELGFETKLRAMAANLDAPLLARITYPYGIMDRIPDAYGACKVVSPFANRQHWRPGQKFRVAIHVRRGDVRILEPDRILPNSYYINLAMKISEILSKANAEFQIEIHTEIPTEDFVVKPGDFGTYNLSEPVFVSAKDDCIEEFDQIPNVVYCINDQPFVALEKMATADAIVLSKSCFGYLAAILNPNTTVFYHSFWHAPLSAWITTDAYGGFDEKIAAKKMLNFC